MMQKELMCKLLCAIFADCGPVSGLNHRCQFQISCSYFNIGFGFHLCNMVLLPFDIVTYVNFDRFEYVFVVIIVIKFHSIRYQKET